MWECKLSLELSPLGARGQGFHSVSLWTRPQGERRGNNSTHFLPSSVQATLFQESRAVGVRSKKYMEGVLERRVARNILIPNANASPSAHSLHAQGSSGARRV